MEKLYQTIKQRRRPEDTAQMILDIQGDNLNAKERRILDKAASGSIKKSIWGYSSMAMYFAEPIGAKKQIEKAIELFKLKTNESLYDPNNIESIRAFISTVSSILKKEKGANNFLSDRMNKEARKESGLDLSKRAYNKRWRLLKRLENKLLKFIRENRKAEFQKIAKHGIIHRLDYQKFVSDTDSACFIAYYTSRCNLRSEFTIYGQQRAFDEISEMLYNRCINNQNTNWWAISHVYPAINVLKNLSDEQKGILLGEWTSILKDISSLLQDVWNSNQINRKSMVVRKGNDSTTWNNTAGAWNKSRDNWMNLIYAMGMDNILDTICFGKVLRLMAGDVVYWHISTGGKLDPNTDVWNSVPLPWEVFEGKVVCNRKIIADSCKKAGLNPEKSGWIAPREHRAVPFRPTPELVHGVTVSNPFLADILKKEGCFSGKPAKNKKWFWN